MKNINLVVLLPHGLEEIGAVELQSLGAKAIKIVRGSVFCRVDLRCFYRIHLQARVPFRILREVSKFRCNGKQSLYYEIQNAFDFSEWLDPSKSFRVDISGVTKELNHSHFTALQVKNAIIDLQRKIWGERSSVNLSEPDVCIHVHLKSDYASLSFATSSSSLHRRGYKTAVGIAPLKENIAAGLLKISNWDESLTLLDPFCGSGTFLLEAASMARGIAPGLNRKYLFETWPDFNKSLWNLEKKEAISLFDPVKNLPKILGFEMDIDIFNDVKTNINHTKFEQDIEIKLGRFNEFKLPNTAGIVVCNPPYGKRLGDEQDLEILYKDLGNFLKINASGWDLWLLNGNRRLSSCLGMRCSRRFPVSNGGIDCRWMHYEIH